MTTKAFHFEILRQNGTARLGLIHTRRGQIRTPAFMPVGTAATVKAVKPESVVSSGAEVILCNTYHLMLRPGAQIVEEFGGLHPFMNWSRPILTDSGGYQVMSLQALRRMTEQGVEFRSHIDGSLYKLSPETSMEIQRQLNSDIVMCLDECTPYPSSFDVAKTSMELSMRWAKRCRSSFGAPEGRALFGIQQGSIYRDLREESAAELRAIDFDGFAIGGLAVGEGQERMFEVLDYAPSMLPTHKPRYLMGVGKPPDIIGAVRRGVDMFDCVLPTRSGRTAQAFTSKGSLNLKNARFSRDQDALDISCACPTCRSYSRGYLHHLFKCKEMLGATLVSEHNLYFYQTMMAGIRDAISKGQFENFADQFLHCYGESNVDHQ